MTEVKFVVLPLWTCPSTSPFVVNLERFGSARRVITFVDASSRLRISSSDQSCARRRRSTAGQQRSLGSGPRYHGGPPAPSRLGGSRSSLRLCARRSYAPRTARAFSGPKLLRNQRSASSAPLREAWL